MASGRAGTSAGRAGSRSPPIRAAGPAAGPRVQVGGGGRPPTRFFRARQLGGKVGDMIALRIAMAVSAEEGAGPTLATRRSRSSLPGAFAGAVPRYDGARPPAERSVMTVRTRSRNAPFGRMELESVVVAHDVIWSSAEAVSIARITPGDGPPPSPLPPDGRWWSTVVRASSIQRPASTTPVKSASCASRRSVRVPLVAVEPSRRWSPNESSTASDLSPRVW